MPEISLIDRVGGRHSIEVGTGRSLMEAIREAGFDELMAMCGGCCSCATCHVYVDEDHAQHLPAMSDDEDDLLDGADHRQATSRLACQVRCGDVLDGATVTIADE